MGIPQESHVCKNCRRFYHHYIYSEARNRCEATYCGHCTYPHMKNRKVYDTCEHFERRE